MLGRISNQNLITEKTNTDTFKEDSIILLAIQLHTIWNYNLNFLFIAL